MPGIEIAIPTHNCAAWLDDLIESILQQDVDNLCPDFGCEELKTGASGWIGSDE